VVSIGQMTTLRKDSLPFVMHVMFVSRVQRMRHKQSDHPSETNGTTLDCHGFSLAEPAQPRAHLVSFPNPLGQQPNGRSQATEIGPIA